VNRRSLGAVRLLLGNKFWYPKGGTETYLFELSEELAFHGYEVIPFAMNHPRNRESAYSRFFVDEVDYDRKSSWYSSVRSAQRILYSAQAKSRLRALVDETKPGLAHLHNIYHQISPSILPLLKRRGIPVVMTLHDLKIACPNYKMRTGGAICERCLTGKYHHAVLNRCVRGSVLASALCATEAFLHRATGVYRNNVDCFIVPSDFFRRKIAQAGIPEEKIVHIPSFTHVERYQPNFGGSDYFVYVGRLSEEKGLPTLLEAMRGLRRGKLVIIGDGPQRALLSSLVESRGLSNVELVGPKSGAELQALLRGAAFSVIPSEWYENCPRAGIESFACGKPVIGSDIGGLPEMIENGRTGLLFKAFSAEDLREKISYLFERESLIVEMGRNARIKAERDYSVKAHLNKLLEVYTRTLTH
jgi:glycosyltransferase involved in cell wall biosynthesis